MNLGIPEILTIAFVALIVFGFGAKKLPDIGKGLGEGIRNFKKAFRGDEEDQKPNQPRTGEK